jgi:hypothetical protein
VSALARGVRDAPSRVGASSADCGALGGQAESVGAAAPTAESEAGRSAPSTLAGTVDQCVPAGSGDRPGGAPAAGPESLLGPPQPVRPARPGPRGFGGRGGGRWRQLPVPPEWRATTVQACGLWPFAAGSSRPVQGVPLGTDLLTGTTVSCDPLSWFMAGLIGNPSMLVLGRPGLGKSSLVARMMLGLAYRGVRPFVLGDLKPDYAETVQALGGQVLRIARGAGTINPLDPGAMGDAAHRIGGLAGAGLHREARDRATTMVSALVQLIRRTPLADYEDAMLAAAVRLLTDPDAGTSGGGGVAATLPDLVRVIAAGPEQVQAVALARGDSDRYADLAEPLQRSLIALLDGPLGATFAGPTTARISADAPAVCVDISGIAERDERLTAAVMLACWSDGFGAIEAANALAEAGLAPARRFFIVLDELWRPLRIGAGLPDRMDSLTRLNRREGAGQAFITHTLKDLESMQSREDQLKARGFAERAGMIVTAGLPRTDLDLVSAIVPLSTREIDLVASWNTPPSWAPRRVRDTRGRERPAPPPGLGKFLIKVGEGRAGIPVQLSLTQAEIDLHDTNDRWIT